MDPGLENVPLPPQEVAEKKPIHVLRTYSSDMAEALRTKQGSVLKIAMAEEKKRQAQYEAMRPTSSRNLKYIFSGLFFILLSIGLFFLFFSSVFKQKATPITSPVSSQIIFADVEESIETSGFSKVNIDEAMRRALDEEQSLAMRRLVPVETAGGITTPLTSADFISLARLATPRKLSTAINEQFFLGIFKSEGKSVPILVFSIKDFDLAYPAAFEWEKDMPEALLYSFDIKTTGDDGLLAREFQGKTLDNQPARILVNRFGEIVLIYGFVRDEYMVVTKSEDAFREAFERLSRE